MPADTDPLYPRPCLPIIKNFTVKGMVHITGGGFYENIPRVLPKGVGVDIDVTSWPQLPIFSLLQKWGGVDAKEMYRTFNMGIGMIMIVDEKDADSILKNLADRDEKAYVIGKVVDSDVPLRCGEACSMTKKKMVIFASGRGSNAIALHDAVEAGTIKADIKALVCDIPGARSWIGPGNGAYRSS